MIKRYVIVTPLVAAMLFLASDLNAKWNGPVEIITSNWGSGPGQFGIESGETADKIPTSFGISTSGRIVIADSINEVLHIYNSQGLLVKDIHKPIDRKWWPYSVIVNGECAAVGYAEFTHTFNIITGELIGTSHDMGGAQFISEDCARIYVGGRYKTGEKWRIYSPTGQIIKTSTSKPIELGIVRENRMPDGKYRIRIQYPDKTYNLSARGSFVKYLRDQSGNLYGVNPGGVWRFNQCGKEIGELLMPQSHQELVPVQNMPVQQLSVEVEYGQPVVGPNGDVYTWKKTPFKYSILKWTWVDDPNVPTGPDAPTGLSVMPSTTGLYLTWTASPQDPGCVTGYEVSRATSAGGVGSTIATVNAGVVKYNDTTASAGTMYYYKVRAKAGSEYSNYTGEVSGKR